VTPEDAENMVNRFQSALHAMRLFSTVMADCRRHGHPLPCDDGSTAEAEAAGKALIAALTAQPKVDARKDAAVEKLMDLIDGIELNHRLNLRGHKDFDAALSGVIAAIPSTTRVDLRAVWKDVENGKRATLDIVADALRAAGVEVVDGD